MMTSTTITTNASNPTTVTPATLPATASDAVFPNLSSLSSQELRALFKDLNVSQANLAEATKIPTSSLGRWLRTDGAVLFDHNAELMEQWIQGKTLRDVRDLHSRRFPRAVHSEVDGEVRNGAVPLERVRPLKRKCVQAQETAKPPPTKGAITSKQVRRMVTKKLQNSDD